MPTDQILTLLILERDKLTRAIETLQAPAKRRGRPPRPSVNPTFDVATNTDGHPREKRHVSAAARRKMALGQKRRWAAVRAAAK